MKNLLKKETLQRIEEKIFSGELKFFQNDMHYEKPQKKNVLYKNAGSWGDLNQNENCMLKGI